MKERTESQEVFEAYTRIEVNHTSFLKAYKQFFNRKPIEIEVDKATGHEKAIIKDMIEIMEAIIKDKLFIEAETTMDEKTLSALKDYQEKLML